MKIKINFFAVLFFSLTAHAYDVEMENSRVEEPFRETMPMEPEKIPTYDPMPHVPIVVERPFISFKCKAVLKMMKLSKDEEGRKILLFNKDNMLKKDLGRLQPNEENFKNSNYGFLNFHFKVKNKKLNFKLDLIGPQSTEVSEEDDILSITLAYKKLLKVKGKVSRLVTEGVNHISLHGNKSLPGGFKLSVDVGEKVIEGHFTYLEVNCTDPKKEIRQIEELEFLND